MALTLGNFYLAFGTTAAINETKPKMSSTAQDFIVIDAAVASSAFVAHL